MVTGVISRTVTHTRTSLAPERNALSLGARMVMLLAPSNLPALRIASRNRWQPEADNSSANGGAMVLMPNSYSGRPIAFSDASPGDLIESPMDSRLLGGDYEMLIPSTPSAQHHSTMAPKHTQYLPAGPTAQCVPGADADASGATRCVSHVSTGCCPPSELRL